MTQQLFIQRRLETRQQVLLLPMPPIDIGAILTVSNDPPRICFVELRHQAIVPSYDLEFGLPLQKALAANSRIFRPTHQHESMRWSSLGILMRNDMPSRLHGKGDGWCGGVEVEGSGG